MNKNILKSDFVFINKDINPDNNKMRKSIGYFEDAWIRFKSNKIVIIASFLLILIVLMCLFGPYVTKYDYQQGFIANKNQTPSKEHWFGTDRFGRDIFTRVCIGGRVSLLIGVVGALVDLIIGLIYGGISGYFGGTVDNIMMRIIEILVSIPYLAVVILISLIIGRGIPSLIIAMTITGWCNIARLIRGQVLQIKSQDYVLFAESLGVHPIKIILNHLLPNSINVIIVAITFDIPSFIFGEAFLSYVGIGIQPPLTSWGALAADAQQQIAFHPYQLFFPALLISLTMLFFQLIGDGLRDSFDPKLRA